MYRTFHVSYQRDDKFMLELIERSKFRDSVEAVADQFCAWTGHRFCNGSIFHAISNWAWRAEKSVYRMPITRDQAEALSVHPDTWAWLDDKDDVE